ncbi:MAG: hypothetical protein ACLTSX_08645 [Collinsella sp.]
MCDRAVVVQDRRPYALHRHGWSCERAGDHVPGARGRAVGECATRWSTLCSRRSPSAGKERVKPKLMVRTSCAARVRSPSRRTRPLSESESGRGRGSRFEARVRPPVRDFGRRRSPRRVGASSL